MLSILIITAGIICIIVFVKDDKYLDAINYVLKDTGEYSKIKYSIDEKTETLNYYLYPRNTDYRKVADNFEKCIQNEPYKNFLSGRKINVYFKEVASNSTNLRIQNYSDNNDSFDRFDTVRVGSTRENYFFDIIDLPGGDYIRGFKTLEIGENYSLKDLKWIIMHFRELETITCYIKDPEVYEELCNSVKKVMPDCKVINLLE